MRLMAFAFTLALSAHAAETCPAPNADPKLAAIDAMERIDFLHRTIDEQAAYALRWRWAWVAVGATTFTAGLIEAGAWAAGSDVTRNGNIVDNLIVSAYSVATPTAAVLFTPRALWDAPVVDELLRQTGGGAAGSCLVLARVEEIFSKSAEQEARNTSWVSHVLAVLGVGSLFTIMAVEAATASIPKVQTAHWANAIVDGVGGLVITEAQLWTAPTGAATGYRRYLRGDLQRKKTVALSIAPLGIAPGLSLRGSF